MTHGYLFAAAVGFGLAFVTGCADDNGKTPNCPDLDLYDLRVDGGLTETAIQKRNAAADKGCVTNPGNATLPGTGDGGGVGGTGGTSTTDSGSDAAAGSGGT